MFIMSTIYPRSLHRYVQLTTDVYTVDNCSSVKEMANPRIRPYIRHYPEDTGGRLDQPWQASRWLHEIDPSVTTPMIRKGHQDFYIFEPTKLTDGTMVIPERWYTKPSATSFASCDPEFWARAWRIYPVSNGRMRGYVVHTYKTVEIPASKFLMSFPHLLETFQTDNQPDPRNIVGA